jgi:branched-chain amino acid transport system substrate-binding protein
MAKSLAISFYPCQIELGQKGGGMRSVFVRVGLVVGVVLLGFTAMSSPGGAATSGLTASAPGITKTTIKIGILSDLTGAAASTFETTPGAMEAAFKLINKEGGVDGRKIIWAVADTQSSPTGSETAVQDLVETQHVFAIAENSALFFAAAPYLHSAGIPATGNSLDGPEWYEQPNTNMFAFSGNDAPSEPGYTDGGFWKATGAKKISFIASNTPSSTDGIIPFKDDMAKDGLSVCDDTIVPLGAVSFTTFALSFKTAGCDAAECSCVLSSTLALTTSLHQEGLTDVKVVFAAGPSDQIFQSKADEATAEGQYFVGGNYSTPGGKAMLAGLKKYDPSFTGGIPDLGTASGWEVANLVIEGIQVAGKNPTRAGLIKSLRQVTNWTDDGLLAAPVSFVHFGVAPQKDCSTYTQFVNDKFVPFPRSGKPFCGTMIPGSGTPPS